MRPIAYSHNTRRGTFFIALQRDGFWHVIFDSDSLDKYDNPQTAAEEVATGVGTWPSFGDPSKLGISEELSDWQPHFSR